MIGLVYGVELMGFNGIWEHTEEPFCNVWN